MGAVRESSPELAVASVLRLHSAKVEGAVSVLGLLSAKELGLHRGVRSSLDEAWLSCC